MKKLLVFIVLINSIKIFAQENINTKDNAPTTEYIFDKADKPAEYPGGINAFRKNFSQTFNPSKITDRGVVKSEVQFVISKEGIITDIIAIGDSKSMNKEMERSIKAMAKTKWKPAEIKEQPVKYRFKLPITMNFD